MTHCPNAGHMKQTKKKLSPTETLNLISELHKGAKLSAGEIVSELSKLGYITVRNTPFNILTVKRYLKKMGDEPVSEMEIKPLSIRVPEIRTQILMENQKKAMLFHHQRENEKLVKELLIETGIATDLKFKIIERLIVTDNGVLAR